MKLEKTVSPEKVTDLKAQAAALLAYRGGLSDIEVASEMGVAVSTLATWKRRPIWRETIRDIGMEAWGEAICRLKASTAKAAGTLDRLMDHDDPRVQLQAAATVLKFGYPSSAI